MHVLLDLDGTLVDTNRGHFDELKYGRVRDFALSDIPVIPGAVAFVEGIRQRGHTVTIVSDSHPTYVGPIAEKMFHVAWLALADKPNPFRLRAHLEAEFGFPKNSFPEQFLFVGDSRLDVQVARGLSIPSALVFFGEDDVPHDPFHNRDAGWARRCMEGATYHCRSFDDILAILDEPAECRLILEDPRGLSDAPFHSSLNVNDGQTLIRGLGRQQQGPCDAYGAIARYYKFGSEARTDQFLQKAADDVSRYLQSVLGREGATRWDLVTCVADKATTKPPRKMANFLHALSIDLPKEEVFVWSPDVTGSIRQEKKRDGRMQFIRRYVSLATPIDLRGKNVIVVDDQYTTGATAQTHVDMLLKAGVKNVLFLALFYLTEEVHAVKNCPRCGKVTRIKYKKANGEPFYSCVAPAFNGTGCGWMGKIESANFQFGAQSARIAATEGGGSSRNQAKPWRDRAFLGGNEPLGSPHPTIR